MLLRGMLGNGPGELAPEHIERASVPHPPIRQEARPGFNLKPGRERGVAIHAAQAAWQGSGLPHLLQKAGKPGGCGRLIV